MNTKEKLLASARDLMFEVGYESMSPAMVLKKSGAGQGSLYHHFSGKKDLARQALEEIRKELETGFLQIFDNEALAPLEKLERFLGRNRNGFDGCKLGRLSNEQALRGGDLHEPLKNYFQLVLTKVEATLQQALAQGDLPADTPVKSMTHLFVAAVQGGYVVSKATNDAGAVNEATLGALAMLDLFKHRNAAC